MQHNNVLDEFDNPEKIYSTFKERLFALFIDGMIVASFTIPLERFNLTEWKSSVILLIYGIIGILYKPFFEWKYGATPGKMALKLVVVDTKFKNIDIKEALFRNIFGIMTKLFTIASTLYFFNLIQFSTVSTMKEYGKFSRNYISTSQIFAIYGVIIIVDMIFLLTDPKKRALHDRIGGTIVIKK
ncbi:MAG TPA: RDD family protein [Ferruginibacter sp.]|jgi:uncharacterized RDD family membrane protein YckC|nr:RDD family protein [Ferruginibacter sp.]